MKHLLPFDQINELFNTTWEQAADLAKERGLTSLSKKFIEHSLKEKDRINLTLGLFKLAKIDGYIKVEIQSIKSISSTFFVINAKLDLPEESNQEDSSNNTRLFFYLTRYTIPAIHIVVEKFNSVALPKTRNDAKNLIKAFEQSGFDIEIDDTRKICIEGGYVDWQD